MCAHKPAVTRERKPGAATVQKLPAGGNEQLSLARHFPDHAYSGIKGTSSRNENSIPADSSGSAGAQNDFYEVEVLRHHPVVSWLEDYLEEVEEIMGKDPWIHGIAEDSPAVKIPRFLSG